MMVDIPQFWFHCWKNTCVCFLMALNGLSFAGVPLRTYTHCATATSHLAADKHPSECSSSSIFAMASILRVIDKKQQHLVFWSHKLICTTSPLATTFWYFHQLCSSFCKFPDMCPTLFHFQIFLNYFLRQREKHSTCRQLASFNRENLEKCLMRPSPNVRLISWKVGTFTLVMIF